LQGVVGIGARAALRLGRTCGGLEDGLPGGCDRVGDRWRALHSRADQVDDTRVR
jgi:hypothetical protein